MGCLEITLQDRTCLGALIPDSDQNILSAVWGECEDREKARKDAERLRDLNNDDMVIVTYPWKKIYRKMMSTGELFGPEGLYLGKDYRVTNPFQITRVNSVEELLDKVSNKNR